MTEINVSSSVKLPMVVGRNNGEKPIYISDMNDVAWYFTTGYQNIDDVDIEAVYKKWHKNTWLGVEFAVFCKDHLNLSYGQAKKIQQVWRSLKMVEWYETENASLPLWNKLVYG